MKKLIQKYGHPSAIIFSNSIDYYNIIWGFDDIFTINDKELDDIDILDELQSKINSWKIT